MMIGNHLRGECESLALQQAGGLSIMSPLSPTSHWDRLQQPQKGLDVFRRFILKQEDPCTATSESVQMCKTHLNIEYIFFSVLILM